MSFDPSHPSWKRRALCAFQLCSCATEQMLTTSSSSSNRLCREGHFTEHEMFSLQAEAYPSQWSLPPFGFGCCVFRFWGALFCFWFAFRSFEARDSFKKQHKLTCAFSARTAAPLVQKEQRAAFKARELQICEPCNGSFLVDWMGFCQRWQESHELRDDLQGTWSRV